MLKAAFYHFLHLVQFFFPSKQCLKITSNVSFVLPLTSETKQQKAEVVFLGETIHSTLLPDFRRKCKDFVEESLVRISSETLLSIFTHCGYLSLLTFEVDAPRSSSKRLLLFWDNCGIAISHVNRSSDIMC